MAGVYWASVLSMASGMRPVNMPGRARWRADVRKGLGGCTGSGAAGRCRAGYLACYLAR